MKTILTVFIFILSLKTQAQITVGDFHLITQIFHAEYDAEIQKQNAKS